jgi:hypothetical protein
MDIAPGNPVTERADALAARPFRDWKRGGIFRGSHPVRKSKADALSPLGERLGNLPSLHFEEALNDGRLSVKECLLTVIFVTQRI